MMMMKRILLWSPIFIATLLSGCGGSGGPPRPGSEAALKQRLREIDDQVIKERRFEELAKQAEREQKKLHDKFWNSDGTLRPPPAPAQTEREKLNSQVRAETLIP